MTKRLVVGGLVALLAGCAPSRSPNAVAWLVAAAEAQRTTAYRATQLVAAGSADGVKAEVEVEADGHGATRRLHRTGPRRGLEVITRGPATWQRSAAGAPWARSEAQASADEAPDRRALAAIENNYRLSARPENLGGRPCLRLDLDPVNRGGPRRRIWVDQASGLRLRTEQRDWRGRLIGTVSVTDIDLRARPTISTPATSGFTGPGPLANLQPLANADEVARRTGLAVHLPAWLPPGYQLSGYFVRTARSGRSRGVLTFSDGLNQLTLFDRGHGPRGGMRESGGTCVWESGAGAEIVSAYGADREWVLLGDLDPRLLERVVNSLP